MEPVLTIDPLTTLLKDLSIHDDIPLGPFLDDLWKKILPLLDGVTLGSMPLVSKKMCYLAYKTPLYIWKVRDRPRVYTVLVSVSAPLGPHAIYESNIVDFLKNMAQKITGCGYFEIAKKVALLPEGENENLYKAKILIEAIASKQLEDGLKEEAIKTLQEAYQMCRDADGYDTSYNKEKDSILYDLAKMQLACNAKSDAEITVQSIQNEQSRAKGAFLLIEAAYLDGNKDEALAIMNDLFSQIEVLRDIYPIKLCDEYPPGSWMHTEREERRELLKKIFWFLYNHGITELCHLRLIMLLDGILEGDIRMYYAWVLHKQGKDYALEVLKEKKNDLLSGNKHPIVKGEELRAIAKLQTQEEALLTLNEAKNILLLAAGSPEILINNPHISIQERGLDHVVLKTRSQVIEDLIEIFQLQLAWEDKEGAQSTLQGIKEILSEVALSQDVLEKILCIFSEYREEDVLEVAEKFPEKYKNILVPHYNKVKALCHAARKQFASGYTAIQEAEKSALAIQHNYRKVKALLEICRVQLSQNREEAKRVLQQVKTIIGTQNTLQTYEKVKFSIDIAHIQIKMDDLEDVQGILLQATVGIRDIPGSCMLNGVFSPYNKHKDKMLSRLFTCQFRFDNRNLEGILNRMSSTTMKIETLLKALHIAEKKKDTSLYSTLSSLTFKG